ncbi:MAG: phosphotransferase [Myxococcales bacterium]
MQAQPPRIPEEVLAAFDLQHAAAEHLPSLINLTFLVRAGQRAVVVQRLHPVFRPEIHFDIEAVTRHLAARGLSTPRLLRTNAGKLWLQRDDGVWRAQTFVEGVTLHRVPDPAHARAAGSGAGRFHAALQDLDHRFQGTRSGVHDTAAHLRALRASLQSPRGRADRVAAALAAEIVQVAGGFGDPAELAAQPRRICHGDLKISNLLFWPGGEPRVRCLIDLDTVGPQGLAYELGDALRSWCNPNAEDAGSVELDESFFAAAVEGYAACAGDLPTPAEKDRIVRGLGTVCAELASRFCRDAVEDSYFGWDPARFPDRRSHNLARARSQLALARQVAARRPVLEDLVRAAFH